ncbi:MAG: hypothetical protein M3X11_15165 [Acidobacteriota bacterium]|nr:hypothetical protein [Acidobacteriota bacterium]
MKHSTAISLAKRLLGSRIRRLAAADAGPNGIVQITAEEIAWANEILATHLDACLCQGIHPDLSDAVEESLDFAIRREKAYEPIPQGARWHGALVMMEEQDAD